jgi:ornithine carbamoyltransferase
VVKCWCRCALELHIDLEQIMLSEEAGTADKILITNSPAEALKDADYVVTDTWYLHEDPKATCCADS